MQTISVIDCETTGLGNTDRVLEIAVVTLDAKTLVTVDEFDTLVNPQRDVGKTDLHGITASMVAGAPTMEEVIGVLSRRINGSVLAAHSLRFDSRMLRNECVRVGADFEPGIGICTLGLAGEKLSRAAERHNIPLEGHHRALVDARVCAELLRRLIDDIQETSPAHLSALGRPALSRTHRRDISHPASITPLQRLVARACVPSSIGACLDYFDALDWVLDDGVITRDEQEFLDEIIHSSNLTASQVHAMQESYLASLIQAVERDSIVSAQELALVAKVARALKIEGVALPEVTMRPPDSGIAKGRRVCFTGTAVDSAGNHIERSELERMAAAAGLQPVSGVSRKSCDLLVAADAATSSGKAKKARDLGIPVIGLSEFLDLVAE
jgi:DNA polymerase-3 subunit epsilon